MRFVFLISNRDSLYLLGLFLGRLVLSYINKVILSFLQFAVSACLLSLSSHFV